MQRVCGALFSGCRPGAGASRRMHGCPFPAPISACRASRGSLLAVAALVLTGGCSRIRDHKGYIVDSTLIDTVQPGIDNRDFGDQDARPAELRRRIRSRSDLVLCLARHPPARLRDPQGDGTDHPRSEVRRRGQRRLGPEDRDGACRLDLPGGGKTPTLGRNRGFFRELFGNIGTVGSGGGTSQGGGTTDNPN